jgi:hypothetical protein
VKPDIDPPYLESWWDELLQAAGDAWRVRRQWRDARVGLDGLATDLKAFLEDPDPDVAQAAAAAIAAAHEPNDRIAALRAAVAEDEVLPALLRGIATSSSPWHDIVDTYPPLVTTAATWILERSPADAARVVADLLDDLAEEIDEPSYSARRMLTSVLAAVAEQRTLRVFTSRQSVDEVVDLFSRLAHDPQSWEIRLLAVRVLGNLQHFTEPVGHAFFAACRDVEDVYRESEAAVTKFKYFAPGSLEWLVEGVRCSEEVISAYRAAILLGELGLRRSEELGHEGRKLVADQLLLLLMDPSVERGVYLSDYVSDAVNSVEMLHLYDVVFETMLRVVSGPDTPTTQAADSGSAGTP